jgi:signal transduction histidine kinase
MRLRGVGVRLSLALLLVVALVLWIVYLVVVPSLERRLVSAKLSQLERAAPGVARQLPANQFAWDDFVENASASANARVVVYDVITPPPTLRVISDSRGVTSTDVEDDPVALQAALSFVTGRGTVRRDGNRFTEVAVPILRQTPVIVLLSASLHDSLGSVDLVRRRLLLAGGLGLAAALLIGFGGASLFARRIRRLERAADRIAGGSFDEPVVDPRRDELGELAQAFDRMRSRLAQFEDARREFIANASHELRTPLFSLAGSLELLADEEMDEETRREFLTTMREQVHRLTKLATELLDLSRLDAGRLRVELEPLHLSELADALVAEFRPVADAHELVLETDPLAFGEGDEQRVLQIGRILVENALLHTPPGTHVAVRVEMRQKSAVLVVEDDGPGLAPDQAEQIFERFYRVDGSVASGSGLGLAIARELAEHMGGSLELEALPGRTTFTLRLPGLKGAGDRPQARGRANPFR